MKRYKGDLLVANVVFQCLDVVYLGGLKGFLFFPCDINPVKKRGAGLLVVLKLWRVQLQILEPEQQKERI